MADNMSWGNLLPDGHGAANWAPNKQMGCRCTEGSQNSFVKLGAGLTKMMSIGLRTVCP